MLQRGQANLGTVPRYCQGPGKRGTQVCRKQAKSSKGVGGGGTPVARAGAAAEGRGGGRRRFRPLHARPLRHRRLALPDHAARRGDAADDRRSRTGDWDLPARGRAGDGARRRFVAGRADGEQLGHRRLLEASQPRARSRRGGPPRPGRARHRAGRSEPGAEAARPVVPGRCVDRLPRHHRRHDGEQLLRRPLAPLRQHPRERHRHRRAAGRRRARRISVRWRPTFPTCRRIRRYVRWRATCSRSARARPTRSRRAFPRCSAGSAATTSTRWCRGGTTSTSRTSWSARKARWRSPPRSRSSCRRCSASVRSAPATSAASTRRWRRRSSSSSSAPIAVELVDATMIGLARDIAMFRPTLEAFVQGDAGGVAAGRVRRRA